MIQTWLLYHNALSTNVVVSDILKYARKSKESGGEGGPVNEDLLEQVNELKKVVQQQGQMLESLGLSPQAGDVSPPAAKASTTETVQRPTSSTSAPGGGLRNFRAKSMSGMELWGEMALGDVASQGDVFAAQFSPPPQRMQKNTDDFTFSPHPDTMPPR